MATFPRLTIPVGSVPIGPMPVTLGITTFTLSFDISANLDPLSLTTMLIERSPDGGVTWAFCCSGTFPGGVLLGDHGVVVTEQTMIGKLPDPTNANRQVRAALTVMGAPAILGPGTLTVA